MNSNGTTYLTGWRKEFAWLQTLRSPHLRRLPLTTLLRLRRFLNGEKLVRNGQRIVINSFLPPFPSRAFDSLGAGVRALRDGRAVPVSAYVAVTNRCRYRCWHCSKAHRPEGEASGDDLVRLLGQIQTLGASLIGFTGGEPLLRDDLPRLVAAVDDRSAALLFTSGDGLTAARAAALKEAGLFAIAISLDHYRPELHDQRRGLPGAFATAIAAIELSRRAGLYTIVQLVGTRDVVTAATMDEYLALARRLGVHEIRLLEPMPTGRLFAGDDACRLRDDERAPLRAVHRRTNARRDLPKVSVFAHVEAGDRFGCGAGFQHLYVDAGGNVCPCDFTPVSFGNVWSEPLPDIWARMTRAFGRPRRSCFLLEHADALRRAGKGPLPIPYEHARRVCDFANRGDVPDYYRAIGCFRPGPVAAVESAQAVSVSSIAHPRCYPAAVS
jgi:MoaA/NifB/PqqE/SkfB family radical SAM enzyme